MPHRPPVRPAASSVVVLWSMIQISLKACTLSAIWSSSALYAMALECIRSEVGLHSSSSEGTYPIRRNSAIRSSVRASGSERSPPFTSIRSGCSDGSP